MVATDVILNRSTITEMISHASRSAAAPTTGPPSGPAGQAPGPALPTVLPLLLIVSSGSLPELS